MTSITLAELMSVLSLGADMGLGEPLETGQRSALLAVALADAAGMSEGERRDAYYLGLLKNVGCVADGHVASAFLGGDEKTGHGWFAPVDRGRPTAILAALAKNIGRGEPPLRRAAALAKSLRTAPSLPQTATAHCEVGSMLASDCGCGPGVIEGLGQVYERWDGRGMPGNARGERISRPIRVAQLAADLELFLRAGGIDAALTMAKARRGSLFDPQLVDVFITHASSLVATLTVPSLWDAVIAAEPGSPTMLSGASLEQALRAVAAFADMPCRWTSGHSQAVAALAGAAGSQLGLDAEACTLLRHAGYLHDIGRVAISTSIWEAQRPLTESERERVRLHAYYTERILARPASLAPLAALASLAHERIDGGGYHRRIPTSAIPLTARILAAADVYAALVADRPHRAAMTPAAAAQMLSGEASAGHLDAHAVSAVLAAAGHATSERRAVALPNGLSSREAEVLALVAVGMTNKEVATRLRISDRTVGHHLQHVYDKLGVSTRAAAALFAQQRGLVAEGATPHQG